MLLTVHTKEAIRGLLDPFEDYGTEYNLTLDPNEGASVLLLQREACGLRALLMLPLL